GVVFALAVKAIEPVTFVIPLHLLLLFTASMVCHGELARDRPPAARLTEFYLWMAAGGVLGGIFNSLIAPLLFQSVVEYPLMIVAALLVAPLGRLRDDATTEPPSKITRALDVALPIGVGVLTLALVTRIETTTLIQRTQYVVAFGVPALI